MSDDPGMDVMTDEISPPVQLSASASLQFFARHLLISCFANSLTINIFIKAIIKK